MFKKIVVFLSIVVLFSSCVGVYMPSTNTGLSTPRPTSSAVKTKVAINFPEGFDGTSKSSYGGGNITVSSGQWYLDNAIMGGLKMTKKRCKSHQNEGNGKIDHEF